MEREIEEKPGASGTRRSYEPINILFNAYRASRNKLRQTIGKNKMNPLTVSLAMLSNLQEG